MRKEKSQPTPSSSISGAQFIGWFENPTRSSQKDPAFELPDGRIITQHQYLAIVRREKKIITDLGGIYRKDVQKEPPED